MADAQISSPAVEAGESVYTIAPAVEFTLKTISAEFADNGAAAAWLPAVLISSDAGLVIARAVDQAVQVQAGDDASVSFFPGVKHAGGGASALDLPWGMRQGDAPTTGTACVLGTAFDDGPAFYTWDAFNKCIILHEPGQYLMMASLTYDETAAGTTPANGRLSLTVDVTETGLSTSWNPWFPILEHTTQVGSTDSAGHKWWFCQATGFVGFDPRMTSVRIRYFAGFSTAATPDAVIEWGIVKISTLSATFPP